MRCNAHVAFCVLLSDGKIGALGERPLLADFVEKVHLGRRTKVFRTADALRTRRPEGPHHFTQKRPPTFASALKRVATLENGPSRDFRRRSIFDFFNGIGAKRTFGLNGLTKFHRDLRVHPIRSYFLSSPSQFAESGPVNWPLARINASTEASNVSVPPATVRWRGVWLPVLRPFRFECIQVAFSTRVAHASPSISP
jgi:hypothetical protein